MNVLPAPPRKIRLRIVLALWWPLGLTTGAMWLLLTVAAAVLLAQDDFRLPTRDFQLDGSGQTVADAAEVTDIEDIGVHMGSRRVERVTYKTRADGRDRFGSSYAWSGDFKVGLRTAIDYLPEDHDVQRLNHAQWALSSTWMPTFAGWFWLPLAVLFGFWLTRVYRLRVVLRSGLEAGCEVIEAKALRWINPSQLRVRFRFVADDGQHFEGWQWLRLGTPLAQRLLALPLPAKPDGVAVIYDEVVALRHRLLGKEHFDGA